MILQTLDHLLTTGSAISSAWRILNSFIFKKASNYSVKLLYKPLYYGFIIDQFSQPTTFSLSTFGIDMY